MNITEMRDRNRRAHTAISVLEVAISVLEQAGTEGGQLDVKVKRPIDLIKAEQQRLLRIYDSTAE